MKYAFVTTGIKQSDPSVEEKDEKPSDNASCEGL